MKISIWKMVSIIFLSIILLGCGSTLSPEPTAIEETDRETTVLIQDENNNAEVLQEFALNNCNGKSDATRIEQRSTSIDVSVSTEIAARIGASAQVISAEVETAVGAGLSVGNEQITSVELNAPPGTHMFFQIVWVGKSQTGVAQNVAGSDIPIAFQSFNPKDFRIKSQYDIGCDNILIHSTPTSDLPQTILIPSDTQSSEPDVIDNLNCNFINELISQGDVIQWIDNPIGSGAWSGVQIRLFKAILVPEGWVVHNGSNIDQYGPLDLPVGTIASVYSPYSCRPLEKIP